MRPRLNLNSARLLVETGTPEGCRSAISRSYYAAYGEATVLVETAGRVVPPTGKSHALVRDLLKATREPRLRYAGLMLNDLYTQRLRADYRANDPFPENAVNVRNAIRMAATIVRIADKVREDARWPEIAEDLRTIVV